MFSWAVWIKMDGDYFPDQPFLISRLMISTYSEFLQDKLIILSKLFKLIKSVKEYIKQFENILKSHST